MLERQLAAIDSRLLASARATRWWGLLLAGVVGVALQILVWSGTGSPREHVEVSLFFASFSLVPGLLMMRGGGRRTSALVERLRHAPRELRALTLDWVAHAAGPVGQLTFEFGQGKRWYVTLPPESARTAFETFSKAYPWIRQPSPSR